MPIRQRSSKRATQAVLRAVTKFVSDLSEQEYRALSEGHASLAIVVHEAGLKSEKGSLFLEHEHDDSLEKILAPLKSASSTEEGLKIVEQFRLSRAALEGLVRFLDLPISKQDGIARLEEKVVEAVVGARLNSKAVRGR